MQLGSKKFLVVTEADKLVAAGQAAYSLSPWLRMDLQKNQTNVNRLKITLMPTDAYTVK